MPDLEDGCSGGRSVLRNVVPSQLLRGNAVKLQGSAHWRSSDHSRRSQEKAPSSKKANRQSKVLVDKESLCMKIGATIDSTPFAVKSHKGNAWS